MSLTLRKIRRRNRAPRGAARGPKLGRLHFADAPMASLVVRSSFTIPTSALMR